MSDPLPRARRALESLDACWSPSSLAEGGWSGALKAAWRVTATVWHGLWENRLPQQAAALTYYALMSVGPFLALALTVSGFILTRPGATGENPAKRAIVAAAAYVAPQATTTDGRQATLGEMNRELDALVDRLLANAASGEAGVIGLGLIIGLAVLMLSRVEDALNGVWGVRKGRSWRDRFANYLLFLVLFFLVGATTLMMLSASSIANAAAAGGAWLDALLLKLPGGAWLTDFVDGGGPTALSVLLLTLAFTAFNRMMPNAEVRWSAATTGGLVVALLCVANQRAAAFYVGKVTELRSLYGELSIVLVLMFGIYLTWLFVLLGGQAAYAFQNRRTLARHKAWEGFSHRARRALAFVCVAETLRRYERGAGGPTAEDVAARARVPATVAEGCLGMLREAGLLAVEAGSGGHRPARPLESMTLGELWTVVDGHMAGSQPDLSSDPAARALGLAETGALASEHVAVTLGEIARRS
jgi:membrane protein